MHKQMTIQRGFYGYNEAQVKGEGVKDNLGCGATARRLRSIANILGSTLLCTAVCETYGVQRHTSAECYNSLSSIEHANALHSFKPHHRTIPTPTPTIKDGRAA